MKSISFPEGFSGIVCETEGDEIIYSFNGLRNRSEGLRINEETAFGIASGTKGFTALAILKLIDGGKLSLDEGVFDRLPQPFPNMDRGVTVRQLLSHTSGIYDYFDEEMLEDFTTMFQKVPIQKIHGPSDMYPLLIEGHAKGKPGGDFCYNNSGFVILAMLVEAVSGMTYKAYLKEAIIDPMGLGHTGCYDSRCLPKNTAIGYETEDGRWLTNTYDIPMICTGDGGLYTSCGDMVRFWDSLVRGDFLSGALRREVFSPQITVSKDGWSYGLGFYLQFGDDGQPIYYGLVGEDPGVSFLSRYFVGEGRHLTIISNTSFGAWEMHKALTEAKRD